MTDRSQIITSEDLTSEEIDRLMRLARKERSIMAHKIMRAIYSAFSTMLKKITSNLARRCIKLFTTATAPAPGTKGVSHV